MLTMCSISVSGTLGLTGGVDTVALIKRGAQGMTLHVEGRDLPETIEMAANFDREACRWKILGAAPDVHRSNARAKILAALEQATEPMGPKDIMAATGRTDRNAVDQLLFKMTQDGDVEKAGHGKYVLPGKIRKNERSGAKHPDIAAEPTNLTDLTSLSGDVGCAPPLGPPGDDLDDFLPPGLR
jgi:hypothetical protein